MRLEARHQEVRHHPDERRVTTELAEDEVERADGPFGLGEVAPLEKGDEKLVRCVSAQGHRRGIDLLRVVRSEHVRKVEELDAILVEPDVIEDGQSLLLHPVKGVEGRASVVHIAGIVRFPRILYLITVLFVLHRIVKRIDLHNLHTSPVVNRRISRQVQLWYDINRQE